MTSRKEQREAQQRGSATADRPDFALHERASVTLHSPYSRNALEYADAQTPHCSFDAARRRQSFLKVELIDLEFSNGERRTYERLKGSGLGAVIIVPMLDDENRAARARVWRRH
jgi:hypothetical protein